MDCASMVSNLEYVKKNHIWYMIQIKKDWHNKAKTKGKIKAETDIWQLSSK